MRQAAASTGNAHFLLLGRLLQAAAGAAGELLGQHDDECQCGFCAFDWTVVGLREDVAGVKWLLDCHAGPFVSNVYGGHRPLTGTPAERLRHIADEMDRLEAIYVAEEDDHGDEPTIAGPPPG